MGSMKWLGLMAVATLSITGVAASQAAPIQETALQEATTPDDRLYGRVLTAGGAEYVGYLRWDKNEANWADLLSGSKEMPWRNVRDAERLDDEYQRRRSRERSVRVLGLRISWTDDDEEYPEEVASGIRFGHLRALRVRGDQEALLFLKSGEEIELRNGSTDLGDDLRELVVEDPERGQVSLRWRDLEEVQFMPAPARAPLPGAERLYGTLHARDGTTWTGFVSWDVDEILTTDVLDGEERGRDRKIQFGQIRAIERSGSTGARVILRNGEEVVLRDSNDVDRSNRGIAISDPALGQIQVDWDEFEQLVFEPAPSGLARYDDFDGGHPLYATVLTEDGAEITGWIRWDNDEEYSWEILDGVQGRVTLDVEFGNVARIVRRGSWGAEVVLRDGRVLEMEDSNDVDEGNKGLFLTFEDGEMEMVPWWEVREVVFHH